MLINSDDIKTTKEHLEVMQAFVDGKEIEFKQDSYKGKWKQTTTPTWDFTEYRYRIKKSEPEYAYPIYKQSKDYGTIIKFTGLDSGEYMTKTSSFNIGDYNNNLVKHTDNTFWKDYIPEYVYPIYKRLKKRPETIIKFTSINAGIYISTHKNSIYKKYEKATALTPHTEEDWEDCNASINENTIELFEVIYYCDILKEFEFVKQLYLDEDLINKRHLYKTGRSFIIDEETRQIIKVINK